MRRGGRILLFLVVVIVILIAVTFWCWASLLPFGFGLRRTTATPSNVTVYVVGQPINRDAIDLSHCLKLNFAKTRL